MSLKTLGNSDLEITPVGLGTWAIGGDGAFGWGPQDDAESIGAIRRSVELGVNWVDTAPVYGLGHSEKIVAKALKDVDGTEQPLVFTKCSFVWDDDKNISHSLRADSIRMEVEASLQRLQVDALDLCQIHFASFPPGGPDDDIEQAWTALAEAKERGKIRYIGVSNFDASQLERAHKIAPITSLQPPYSMLMRGIEDEVLPFCQQHNIGVIVYSPMHAGLLTGAMTRERIAAMPASDWRLNFNPAFREPHLTRNLELVELLKRIGEPHGRSPGEVAIAWTLRHPAVTAAIVGGRRASQVDGFIGAMDFRLTEAEVAEIDANLPESLPGLMSVP
jgi:aryl-alcohol dehydrogenase-like predicted oxidoreductase